MAYGGDGAVVVWEFPATGTKGKILCIGSGCYDWYSVDDVPAFYHNNTFQDDTERIQLSNESLNKV